MKIFAAGISTETNTFSTVPTGFGDFIIQRGSDAQAGRIDYPNLDLSEPWGRQARARGDEFVFGFMAWALPSGITIKADYEALREDMLRDLRSAMPVDVVLLMLHGAMVAQGYDDCEQDIIGRVREIVGPAAVIGVELDLHCHLSQSTIAAADIVITYKEYPHVDVNDRARELFDLAVATKQGVISPVMALFDCRMVGMYPTSREPLRSLVDAMSEAERREGVLSISFGHGFQFADVPHVGAKILVVANADKALAERVAEEFGVRAYERRKEIGFDSISLSLDQALATALAASGTPVVVADQSDNIGGGAPGDATGALRWLLDRDATEVGMAIFYDPEVVKIASKVGQGGRVAIRLGGKMGPCSGDPVDMEVTVLSVLKKYMHKFPQDAGDPQLYPAGDVVALRCGSIDLIVSSERCQCMAPSIFSDLGIDPARKRLLVVKSAQHFYGAFAPIAGEVIYMSAPGAVPPDPRLVSYRRFDMRKMFPWCEDPLNKES